MNNPQTMAYEADDKPAMTQTQRKFENALAMLHAEQQISSRGADAARDALRADSMGATLIPMLWEMQAKTTSVAKAVGTAFGLAIYPSGDKDIPPTDETPRPGVAKHGAGYILADNGVAYLVNPMDAAHVKRLQSEERDLFKQLRIRKYGIISKAHHIGVAEKATEADDDEVQSAGSFIDDSGVKKRVDDMLLGAARRNASDIHLEPTATDVRVRLRIDSNMVDVDRMSHEVYKSVANVILNQCKKGKPGTYLQALDDMFIFEVPPSRKVKFRVMMVPVTLPGLQSELPCFCLRLLGNAIEQIALRDLGVPNTRKNPQLTRLQMLCERKNGLILVSGPTGSGKTTTLQAVFSELQRMHPNRCRYTAEDPVEMNLTGVNHIQVNEEAGLSFARCVKSFLRGDPDDVLIGEIRDYEVASQALTGSITGHLVFSTIHTNSAIETVTRLIDLGCDAFLVAAALKGATAQRLVRKVCRHCGDLVRWSSLLDGSAEYLKDPENLTKRERYLEAAERYGDLLDYPRDPSTAMVYVAGSGCSHCSGGYKGRLLITELLEITPTLGDLISRRSSVLQLRRQALREKFQEMWQHAATEIFIRKSTTFDEMIDAVGEREWLPQELVDASNGGG